MASQPPEDIIIENYASALPKYLGMFIKQAGKITLVETFDEAIKVEKNSLMFDQKIMERMMVLFINAMNLLL